MYRFLVICLSVIVMCGAARGDDDCLNYKINPRITVSAPEWTKQVVQPLRVMDYLHGDVIATFVDNYDITVDVTDIEGGTCVALKSLDAVVGYSDFLVQIDIRHLPDTCSYNAILSHEDEHIRAYLGIIDDVRTELHTAARAAADSIMPVFVTSRDEIDAVIDSMNDQIQSHPDLILVKQKIMAAEEIKNRTIDANDNGQRLQMCM